MRQFYKMSPFVELCGFAANAAPVENITAVRAPRRRAESVADAGANPTVAAWAIQSAARAA
jgi:hypothetical protein